jgi:pyruvate dehydrogenase complex dehydrogenase (E1) component
MVKWYMFWDALTRQRTDGSLVRMIMAVPDGQSVEHADAEMQNFLQVLSGRITAYVPD